MDSSLASMTFKIITEDLGTVISSDLYRSPIISDFESHLIADFSKIVWCFVFVCLFFGASPLPITYLFQGVAL